jgi:hypothetical protein
VAEPAKTNKKVLCHLALFLRNTICLETSPWQPITSDMCISEALGKWLPVERNILHTCSRTRDSLYYHDEESGIIGRFDIKGDCGLFKFVSKVSRKDINIPLTAHPIDCRFVDGEKLYGLVSGTDPGQPRWRNYHYHHQVKFFSTDWTDLQQF